MRKNLSTPNWSTPFQYCLYHILVLYEMNMKQKCHLDELLMNSY